MGGNSLWEGFLKGDKKALALIFQQKYEELFNYGIRLSNSKGITEDCLQDLFLKLWKNKGQLGHVENYKAYLYTALRNMVLNQLTWQSKFVSNENAIEADFEIVFSREDILIRNQISKESRNALLTALNGLSAKQKEAIYLKYFDEMEFETIADIMGVNVQSVRNFIHRGISVLRKDLKFI